MKRCHECDFIRTVTPSRKSSRLHVLVDHMYKKTISMRSPFAVVLLSPNVSIHSMVPPSWSSSLEHSRSAIFGTEGASQNRAKHERRDINPTPTTSTHVVPTKATRLRRALVAPNKDEHTSGWSVCSRHLRSLFGRYVTSHPEPFTPVHHRRIVGSPWPSREPCLPRFDAH